MKDVLLAAIRRTSEALAALESLYLAAGGTEAELEGGDASDATGDVSRDAPKPAPTPAEALAEWNALYPIGTLVEVRKDDGGRFLTRIADLAELGEDGEPEVRLVGSRIAYHPGQLRRHHPRPEA